MLFKSGVVSSPLFAGRNTVEDVAFYFRYTKRYSHTENLV